MLLLKQQKQNTMAIDTGTSNGGGGCGANLWLTEGVRTTEAIARDFIRLQQQKQQQQGGVGCNAFTIIDLNRVMAEMDRWRRELPSITVSPLFLAISS